MLQFEDLWDLSAHLTISDGRRKDSDTIYDEMQLKFFLQEINNPKKGNLLALIVMMQLKFVCKEDK